jgi:polyphosphate kinase
MPRNFFKRIEVAFPLVDGRLRDRVIHEILALPLADNVKARLLQPDGTYVRAMGGEGEDRVRSQERFMDLARRSSGRRAGAEEGPRFRVRRTPDGPERR